MSNKPDESWIMNRLIKQLTDMGFPVSKKKIYICTTVSTINVSSSLIESCCWCVAERPG